MTSSCALDMCTDVGQSSAPEGGMSPLLPSLPSSLLPPLLFFPLSFPLPLLPLVHVYQASDYVLTKLFPWLQLWLIPWKRIEHDILLHAHIRTEKRLVDT